MHGQWAARLRRWQLNLLRLRSFLALQDAGSFRLAAERLGLSQPALSRQIQVLEAELGATLLRRGRPPLALTEAGRFVAQEAPRLLADAALLQQEAKRLHGGRDPTLCLGVLQSLLEGVFARALLAWRQEWPDVKLRVLGFQSGQIMREVAEGRQHLGVVGLPPGDPRLVWRPLAEEPFLAVLPPGHALARAAEDAVSLADLAAAGLVLPPPAFGLRQAVDAAFAAAGLAPRLVAELEGIGAILALVQAGLGPSILPASAVPASAQVACRALAGEAPRRSLGVVWHRSRKPDAVTLALVAALEDALAETASLRRSPGPPGRRSA
jgi:DNA-binding transcriptional LysR family regulator